MGILRTTTAVVGWGSLATVGTFVAMTRKSRFVSVSTTDEIFTNVFYLRNNPEKNPSLHDLCVRRVPLDRVKPELLEKDGKLVEAFCAGVWSGLAMRKRVEENANHCGKCNKGYTIQRKYLERKYRGPSTAHQLWERDVLQDSSYPVGTEITDHFEVLSHSASSILVRCGDSPMNKEVRASDGLFEMRAEVKQAEGVAEFQLKNCFYQGLGKSETGKPPLGPLLDWAHRLYTKLWMESAIRNVMK
ncbi:MAG: hypothetical protein M1822_004815 [Bathelium mastoideum]|nr:MAG: hypothetical protein M1822_004815 [Bathelium mastoideum]